MVYLSSRYDPLISANSASLDRCKEGVLAAGGSEHSGTILARHLYTTIYILEMLFRHRLAPLPLSQRDIGYRERKNQMIRIPRIAIIAQVSTFLS